MVEHKLAYSKQLCSYSVYIREGILLQIKEYNSKEYLIYFATALPYLGMQSRQLEWQYNRLCANLCIWVYACEYVKMQLKVLLVLLRY